MLQAIKKWLAGLLLTDYVGSVVRTGMAVVAGSLLAKGIINQDQYQHFVPEWTDLILAILAYLIAQSASIANKKL